MNAESNVSTGRTTTETGSTAICDRTPCLLTKLRTAVPGRTRHQAVRSSAGSTVAILNLVVSFTPRPLYPLGKNPALRTEQVAGRMGLQSQSGRFAEYTGSLPLPGIDPRLISCPAVGLVTILTELYGSHLLQNVVKQTKTHTT